MNRKDITAIGKAIAALNLWEKASAHNWALVPQTSELPYLVTAGKEEKKGSPVLGRLHLFPGFVPFRDFMLSRRMNDFGVGMSSIDFEHFELVSAKGGVTELFIPKSDLPSGNALVFSVCPITSLGTRGKPLSAKWASPL